jgi:hypothetical protein
VYGLEDAYLMLEVNTVDAANNAIWADFWKKQRRKG